MVGAAQVFRRRTAVDAAEEIEKGVTIDHLFKPALERRCC
jgi:hypothetical protein